MKQIAMCSSRLILILEYLETVISSGYQTIE